MAGSRPGPGEQIQRIWLASRRWPAGDALFSFLLGRMVPYSGSIGARVVELEPGRARLTLRDRRKVRNHLRSIHAIALINLGELTTGLALNCGLDARLRSILVGVGMDYLKKARGTLTAESRVDLPPIEADRDLEIEGTIRDEAGDVVAVARARWRVGPLPSPR